MARETVSDAKRRLLEHMKRSGPTRVKEMAEALALTEVAVRQHLQMLECAGLVSQIKQPPIGRGRPSVLWSLTSLADAFFPDHHAELAVDLIQAMRQAFGDEGLERLVSIRSQEQLNAYHRALPSGASLRRRVEALAEQRTQEGYMAEAVECSEEEGSFLLIEHHCPIQSAARQCESICSSELELFRQTLGDQVRVERVQHLLDGDDRCSYRITVRPPSKP